MHTETMKVKRDDMVVIINVEDFNHETDTMLDDAKKPRTRKAKE